MLGRKGRKLTVITAYKVVDQSLKTAAAGSAIMREWDYFRTEKIEPSNPRTRFNLDIRQFISEILQGEVDHEIVLLLDANGPLESISDIAQDFNLVDLHEEQDCARTTQRRSSKHRIDFILGTPGVKAAVRRAGALAYSEGIQSDHRGLFVDLDISFILDNGPEPIPPNTRRGLKSTKPDDVLQYVKTVMRYLKSHKVQSRIKALKQGYRTMTKSKIRKQANAIDRDMTNAMLHGEKELAKPGGQFQWSPQLRQSSLILRYWRRRYKDMEQLCYSGTTYTTIDNALRQVGSQIEEEWTATSDMAKIKERLHQAKRSYRQCVKDHANLRIVSLHKLLEKYESDTNRETRKNSQRKAGIVSRAIEEENTRAMFRKIGNAVNPNVHSALEGITIPTSASNPDMTPAALLENPPGDLIWERVMEKESMEKELMEYNRYSFRKAASSPCGHGTIHDALTFAAISDEADKILHGIVDEKLLSQDSQPDLLREFLKSFAIPSELKDHPPISSVITRQQFEDGIKRWPEATSTSPSGRHLGHYRAMITHPIFSQMQVDLMNIAIQNGIALQRWSKSVTVMIEKDQGDPKINRLRIIHLFEADYNLFLKLQWGKRLVRHAEEKQLIHESAWGGRAGRTSIDPVLLKHLTADICRILKANLSSFDNDASACYDRIIIALGMLASQRMGQSRNATLTHAEALQWMRYAVKTVHGISESNYQGTIFAPLFGTGQGSGASPAIWLLLSVVLMTTIDRLAPERMVFVDPETNEEIKRLLDTFVDDTTLGFTDLTGEKSYDELIYRTQAVAQIWERLLFYSGGALNLKKCFYYILYWEWDEKGRPRPRASNINDPTVKLRSGDGPTEVIRRLDLNESHRTLGVYINPIGDFTVQLQKLKEKADKLATRLLISNLTKAEVRTFHRSIYRPAISYVLPALAIDAEELHQVQTKSLSAISRKQGLPRTFPRAVLHGPRRQGGQEMMDLRTEVGIVAISKVCQAVRRGTAVGKMFSIGLKYLQLESGLDIPLHHFSADSYIHHVD